jgi:hypothetical protein
MGLREKHSAYSKLFILFFNEGSPSDNFKIGILEIKMGVVLCATRSPFNVRCNSESMRGTMKRLEKVTLDLFKARRKSK